ncbi:MAG: signal peptide peptidase SppA [Myxococcota bacterium]
MMRRTSLVTLALTALAVVASPTAVLAQDEPSPSEGIALPNESLTGQSDSASLEVNPAGLGFMSTGELSFAWQMANQDLQEVDPGGQGLFLAGGTGNLGAGFGVQWLNRPELGVDLKDYRKYSFGLGFSTVTNLAMGVALNFFGSANSERLDSLATWDLGLQWRPLQVLGVSWRTRDLNRAFIAEGESLPHRNAAGVMLRFLDGQLQLESELAFNGRGDSIFVRPRVLLEPVRGVRVFARGQIDVETINGATTSEFGRIIAGLELNTNHFGIQGAGHFDPNTGEDDPTMPAQSYRAWVSLNKRPGLAEPGQRWLLVDLTQNIVEQPTSSLFGPSEKSFLSLLDDIRTMQQDPNVEGVVFNVGQTAFGYGQSWELREAISDLRDSGKSTVSVLSAPTFKSTYIASASEHVWLLPTSPYDPAGVGITLESYQGTLEKIGVKAEFLRIGDYKSAPEAYTRSTPSKESLEQTQSYLDTIYENVVAGVADDRDLRERDVERAVDDVPIFPEDAIGRGFIDDVVYIDGLDKKLREEFGGSVQLEEQYREPDYGELRYGGRPQIAVVNITGAIVQGRSGGVPVIGGPLAGSDTLTETLEAIARNPTIRAVVIRVDSPGGSAVASDLIYRGIRRLSTKKPVIASMGNVAASGGYYVAAGADEIFATPNTLTGSIGIFTGKFSISELADFIGLNATRLERGERSGLFDIYEPWTESERESVSRSITYLYELFLQQVARTRPLTANQVDEVARGRIWAGEAAREQKLVDRRGGLMDAIARAEELAKLQPGEASYRTYPAPTGLLSMRSDSKARQWMEERLSPGEQHPLSDTAAGSFLRTWGEALRLPLVFNSEESLMMMPYYIDTQ